MGKKEKFDLYTNDKNITLIIAKFKNNQKLYLRILELLQLIGKFDGKTNVELYEIIEHDGKQEIKVCLSDLDDDIFILTPISTEKVATNKIEKWTNYSVTIYDLSLAKKNKLTSENVIMLQTRFVYDFKFGRLVTDNKNFYNIFLGGNICYHIDVDFVEQSISIDKLITKLNQMDNSPKLIDYAYVIDEILKEEELKFNSINLSAFQNLEQCGRVTIDGNNKNSKILKR